MSEQKQPLEQVPFHEAKLEAPPKTTLRAGLIAELGEGRRVEIWRCVDREGFCIRLFHPTLDGKLSRLVFGLKSDAAAALVFGLQRQLMSDGVTVRMAGFDGADGVGGICHERMRQISAEGWTAEHDDAHTKGEMAMAAVCYASLAAFTQCRNLEGKPSEMYPPATSNVWWPWDESWWKPSDDPIRNLEKAGALIAAEIDRLKRRQATAGK